MPWRNRHTLEAWLLAQLDDLQASHLSLINESHRHSTGSDHSHYKLVLVSAQFRNRSRLQRHREVQHRLAAALAGPVHALALHLYSPEEWARQQQPPASPPCRGGSTSDQLR